MNALLKVVAYFFVVISVTLIGFGIFALERANNFRDTAIKAEGTVINLIPSYDSENGSTTYAPEITFTAQDNKTYTFRSNYYTAPSRYQVNDKAVVWYNPENPANAEDDGHSPYILSYILWAIAAVMLLLSVLFFFLVRKMQRAQFFTRLPNEDFENKDVPLNRRNKKSSRTSTDF